MKKKMTLLYFKPTKAVLAAVTRVGEPAAAEDQQADKRTPEQKEADEVAALVGSEIRLRLGGKVGLPESEAEFVIPGSELGVVSGEFESSILTAPRDYYLDSSNAPQPADMVASVVLKNNQVEITVPASTAEIEFRAYVEPQGTTDALAATPKKSTSDGSAIVLPIATLPSGNYLVIAFASGFKPSTIAASV